MSKIKIKQIHSDGQPEGAVLMTDGEGNNYWGVPEVASGSNTFLGAAEDGSYTESRYVGGRAPAVGLEPTTRVSSAIDSLNEVLGLLLPTAPANLSTGTLSLSTSSSSARVAQGYTTNSLANAPVAGSSVARITATAVNTNVLEDLGAGNAGSISLFVNDAISAGETLNFTDNTGDSKTTGFLRITDNKWGGTAVGGGAAPDGFFQTFDSQVVGAPAVLGLNRLQLRHSQSGNTNNLSFVRDDLTANPVVSAVTVTEVSETRVSTSGVRHYGTGSVLAVSGDATNLAGQTYSNGTILSLTGQGTAQNFAAGTAGLPSILNVNTLDFSMAAQNFTITASSSTKTGKITLTATNPNGSGNATHSTNLLIASASGLSDNLPNAKRVYLGADGTGDTPAASTITDKTANDNAANLSATQDLSEVGFKHEAVVAGGSLSADKTNWTVGYLPAQVVDYTTKDNVQYVTYRLNVTAKSSISVNITGSYAGMWVALPGVSTNNATSPAALGGAWWNARALYSGAGVPGKSGDAAAGCANGSVANGGNGTTVLTFGSASSSSATNNAIFVRLRLNAGQSITAISIS